MERAKGDHRYVVIITAFCGHDRVLLDAVTDAIVFKFDLTMESFKLCCYDETVFIALVADEATARRMAASNGPVSSSSKIRLHYWLWSRQAFPASVALLSLVDIKLQGISAHAWEVATAENQLDPNGRMKRIGPETRFHEDYTAFKCSTWCLKPEDLPPLRDLYVVEPT